MSPHAESRSGTGVVLIGRNEGERLLRCLRSVDPSALPVVYVDSGSTDGSVAAARAAGAAVVELDLSRPFTAARARNAGFAALLAREPGLAFVQFVDGDCEVVPGWLARAEAFLGEHPEVAVVCGRRRERHPERSVFNRLCDLEWDTPVGAAKACGGDALMRVAPLRAAGGFRDELIAGEEPELCLRLRAAGWGVWRLDAEMTWHDAAMLRWSQWWKRTMRAGWAFAEGARLHGAPPERHWVRESRSAWLWGLALPLAVLVLLLVWWPAALVLAALVPLQVGRIAARLPGPGRLRLQRAFFLVAGKLPEAVGQLRYVLRRRGPEAARLIEYK